MILVTGGAGFIGSHLVERLLAQGQEVHVYDSFVPVYDPRRKWKNLAAVLDHPGLRLTVGDIRDAATLREALAAGSCRAVIHLAALAGVRASLAEPARFADVNVVGTAVVLDEARRAGVERLVLGSSSSVYGDSTILPLSEGASEAPAAASPYGATKRALEDLAQTHAALTGAAVAGLRFFTVYGPRQRPDMAIHKFARLIAAGRSVPLYGDGSSQRDYTFVADIVDGILAALERAPRGFRAYNLGRGETVKLAELVHVLMTAMGVEVPVERGPEAPGDVRATASDLTRSHAELGYAPRVSLAQGLASFVAWFRAETPCAV